MKRLLTALFALTLAAGFMMDSAEAARLGGGRSMGIQRSAPMQRQATPPTAAKPAAPATQPGQPAGNRWFGPLAGLAAGLGLGWLIGQGGLGGGLLMALLAGAIVMFLVRMFANRRAEPARPLQYANSNWAGNASPAAQELQARTPEAAPGIAPQSGTAPQIPADFDAEAFLKHAKRNFLQLQEANDRADLTELREVTTPEMFDSLKGDVVGRGARQQQTEIVALNASLLEVVTEDDKHWASVRFSGTSRESPSSAPETFDEVWNLQKPVDGHTGWLLAGIQQPA